MLWHLKSLAILLCMQQLLNVNIHRKGPVRQKAFSWHGVIMHYINSLCPSDTIWQHRSASTLAQVMACCLMAPSHYPDQCWLIISEAQSQSPEDNFTRDASAINYYNQPENYLLKISFKSPRGQWVNSLCAANPTEKFPHNKLSATQRSPNEKTQLMFRNG